MTGFNLQNLHKNEWVECPNCKRPKRKNQPCACESEEIMEDEEDEEANNSYN